MDGITFFRTADRERVVGFYVDRLDCRVWREQPDCTILRRGDYALGFCARDPPETDGCLTFLCDDRSEVDALHARLDDVADGDLRYNETYAVYQFFAEDPEGRAVEVQTFE
ncbi:VOC family protein [Halorarius litoreus]|uniref:VOC family protein n=1 Tax=Halorarius litoreus TaxID=2962676 RepID=UPI0020CF3A04|nr:VOC family protein [Halorarius litoreus]